MSSKQYKIKIILRVVGSVVLLALFPVFFPRSWMDAVHRAAGMGPLPEGIIVDYLARSLSALYAIHGALLWFLSFNIKRYAPVILFVAWAGLALGLLVLCIDTYLGMPLFWTLTEGPVALPIFLPIIILMRGIEQDSAE